MNIFIGSDHVGFNLKRHLLDNCNITLKDLGTYSNQSCDYPLIAQKIVQKILENQLNYGILICGTGIGMSIAANRFRHIRAALCYNEYMAEMAKKHNNANIIVLGANLMGEKLATNCVERFFNTEFIGYQKNETRHLNRTKQIDEINL